MNLSRLGFRTRLLLANLAIVAVGAPIVFVGVGLIAPGLFNGSMDQAMGSASMGMGTMMDGFVRGAFQDAVRTALLVATGAAILAAVALSFILSAQVSRPIGRLDDASRRIATGDYGERVPVDSDDEIGRLAMSFNQMAASLEATERRRTELVGDVAHELRTPLATLDGYLEGLEDGVVAPDERTWRLLRTETTRLTGLVDDLQQLWRAEAGQLTLNPRAVDAAVALRAAADRFEVRARERSVTMLVQAALGLPALRADPDRLAQVLDNYIANALRYGPSGQEIVLSARPERGGVTLSVADHGPGLSTEQRDRVFERFYRVDASRSRSLGGSGIGLAVARALAQAMGGRVWAESDGPGAGSRFLVWMTVAV